MSTHPTTATITPDSEAERCDEGSCEVDELLARVEPDDVDEARVLCPTHRVAWLREVANR